MCNVNILVENSELFNCQEYNFKCIQLRGFNNVVQGW